MHHCKLSETNAPVKHIVGEAVCERDSVGWLLDDSKAIWIRGCTSIGYDVIIKQQNSLLFFVCEALLTIHNSIEKPMIYKCREDANIER